jgi:hypothetical protein
METGAEALAIDIFGLLVEFWARRRPGEYLRCIIGSSCGKGKGWSMTE